MYFLGMEEIESQRLDAFIDQMVMVEKESLMSSRFLEMQRNLVAVIVVACDDDQSNNHRVHSQEYPHRCFSPRLNHGEQIYI